ncbi:MAG: M48 family metalloprotease [Deltaproteobacteria bacterium]|jgi:predicted Zn-dependent protease|nr:M48 family metalloprotease [Deltaproteobacteria bacterium]
MGFVLKNKTRLPQPPHAAPTLACTRLRALFRPLRAALFLLTVLLLSLPFITASRANAVWSSSFSTADEEELGKKFDVLVRSRLPLVQDPEIINYFISMVQRLSTSIPPQPFEFKVNIIQHNAVNAFAVPGGYVFINTGLITAMNTPAEIAGVLAHEMAHVTQRHIAKRIEAAKTINVLSVLGMLAGALLGGDVGQAAIFGSAAAGQAALLNYSRADESEADQVGFNYLLAAKYPPHALVDAFVILQRPQWITGSNFPSYLSTHPDIASRIRDIDARIKNLRAIPSDAQSQRELLEFARIQTLVRGRYATPEVAQQFFNSKAQTENEASGKSFAYLGQALVFERKNQIKDAAAAYRNAVAVNPHDPVILREAGRFHYLKGNSDEAVVLLAEAIRLNRNDYPALFYYARMLDDSGQSVQAADYYKNILQYVPEDAEVHQYYAQALGKNNRLFLANLHLAYSAMYMNNAPRTTQFYERAKKLAVTPEDKNFLELFDKKFKERSAYWS